MDSPVVVDKSQPSELVHKRADTRARRTDHLGQRFLADGWDDGLDLALLAEVRQQQKKARQALFAGIEQLVDHVLFGPGAPAQEIRDEQVGEFRFVAQRLPHDRALDAYNRALLHGRGADHALGLTVEASFAEKIAGSENCEHGFLATLGQDRDLDFSLLDIKYGIGGIPLSEHHVLWGIDDSGSGAAHLGEKTLRVEGRSLDFSRHGQASE